MTALLSWIDARFFGGQWLLRIEDIDEARTSIGSTDSILRCLEKHGLVWDGAIAIQSQRHSFYHAAIEELKAKKQVFWCDCSREALKSTHGLCISEKCSHRRHAPADLQAYSIRLLVNNPATSFHDRLQGQQWATPAEVGGFALVRRDGTFAYNLVAVVDDYLQKITNIVRGADLLTGTFAQLNVQQALGYPQPSYAHTPLLVNDHHQKLSKQNRARPANPDTPTNNIRKCLALLNCFPPEDCDNCNGLLEWTLNRWDSIIPNLQGVRAIVVA